MSLAIHKIQPSRRDLLLLISVPEFDGTNIPLRRFLRHARKATDGADNVPTMYAQILTKIKGLARERVQESSTDFDSMAAELKVAFGSMDDSKYWQERLLAVEQKPGQSVADYGKDVQWIRSNIVQVIRDEHEEKLHCGMIRMIDELSMRAFHKGLSGDLQVRYIMNRKFDNLELAICSAGTREAVLLKEIPPPAVTIASAGAEEPELLEGGPPPAVTIASADAILPSRRDSLLLIFVPEFDGTNIPLRRFLRHARKAIDEADNVPTVYALILAKIKGQARKRVQESSRDFDSMAADLKAFGSVDDLKHWQECLFAVKQKPEQSVAGYGKDVQWICSNIVEIIRDEHEEEMHCGMIRMIDELSIRAFLKGLSGVLQDRDAMKMKFENLEQAIDCAGAEVKKLLWEVLPPAEPIDSADAILRNRRNSILLAYVPEFDGTNVPLRHFLLRARYAIVAAGNVSAGNVSAIYRPMVRKIKGDASKRVQESRNTFNAIAGDLELAFGSLDDSIYWQERLLAVEQKPRQSVPDYGKDVQWIRSNIVEVIGDEHEEELHCGMIRMIDELSMRAFLKGLSGDLQDRDAMKMKFENLEQAIDCAGAEVAELLKEIPPPAVTIASADVIPKICSICSVGSHTDSTCTRKKGKSALAAARSCRQNDIQNGGDLKVKQCKYCMKSGHLVECCRKQLNKKTPANLELWKIYNIFHLAMRPENYVRLDCLNPAVPIHEVATENGVRRMVYLHINNRRHVFYLSSDTATNGSESGILGIEFMMSQGATLNYKRKVAILSNEVELPFDGSKVIIEASPMREAQAYTYVNED